MASVLVVHEEWKKTKPDKVNVEIRSTIFASDGNPQKENTQQGFQQRYV